MWVIDPQRMVTDRHDKYRPRIDHVGMWRSAGLYPPSNPAVGAVGIFPAFTYGLLIAPRVSFCRNAMPMHLASDYIHPYKDAGGRPSYCRVRIYLPDTVLDAPVVVCSEVPNNPGGSITNSAEVIAAGVIQANEVPTPLVWIEHWPKESTDGGEETFELVVFSS